MLKVLLVEDEPDLQLMMQTRLGLAGIGSEAAASLEEARRKIATGGFDAILLDLLLGEESGWSLIDELKAGPGGHPPVIVISAYVASDTRERAAAAGCEWLPKPFTPDELRQVLERVSHGGAAPSTG